MSDSPGPKENASLSGALGLVLIPDPHTIEKSYALASQVLPEGSEYVLGQHSLPHITLYHGVLREVPLRMVRELRQRIHVLLEGEELRLRDISLFGGNFVFWNVENPSRGLLSAHVEALSLAQYLDPRGISKATSEEQLALTEAQLANVKQYGHPLVKEFFQPHITLGFQKGLEASIKSERNAWIARIHTVEFVRVGFPGRVEEVIDAGDF
jgi:2'-5' RNA ligase